MLVMLGCERKDSPELFLGRVVLSSAVIIVSCILLVPSDQLVKETANMI